MSKPEKAKKIGSHLSMPSSSPSPPPRHLARTPSPVPPAEPLIGCCIAASGSFSGHRVNQTSILSTAETLGASVSKSITHQVTHLITSQNDCDKASTKVNQAIRLGIFLVSLEWLQDCEEFGSKLPEANYTLTAADYRAAPIPNTYPTGPGAVPTKKRQVSHSPEPEPKKTKLAAARVPAIGKSQIAKDWAVQVPLDEGCSLTNYGVHVDDDSVIWDATLNQSNSGNNANKFYRVQLLVGPDNDCKTWTRWGRLGLYGQSKVHGSGSFDDAIKYFKTKFKDKSGLAWENRMETPKPGRYAFVELNYDPESDLDLDDDAEVAGAGAGDPVRKPPPSTLDEAVQNLMRLIFNKRLFAATMLEMNYNNEKLPLGKLSRATIMRGFATLKNIAAVLQGENANLHSVVETNSDLFYSLIPHNFGRQRPPVISNLDTVKKEIELLETLADMKDASNIMKSDIDELNRLHPLDRQFHSLGLKKLTPLDHNSDEFKLLTMYLSTTRGSTHAVNYEVIDIFSVTRDGEQERFNQSIFARNKQQSDRRLLWHGSRVTNYGGILSQGLRIAPPEAPVSGYMFGKGVYLADMSSKSVNYCSAHISDGTALLLLCEAELGKPMHERTQFQYDASEKAKAKGSWSTFGKGGEGPLAWKDASCVHRSLRGVTMPSSISAPPGPTGVQSDLIYNEYICYDEHQVLLRYLFRVNMIYDF